MSGERIVSAPGRAAPNVAAPSVVAPGVAAPIRWADLRLRVLSALVLAPVALACLWFGGLPWAVLVGLMAIGLSLEWAQLCGRAWSDPSALALTVVVLLAGALALLGATPAAAATIAVGVAVIWVAAGGAAPDRGTGRRASLAAGAVYVGLTALALPWLRADPLVGAVNLLFVVMVVWSSDIAAYAAGRLIGGRRLAPAISPGKTWSGAAGGLVGAMAVGAVAAGWSEAAYGRAMLVAGGLGVVSQAGDLFESALKRHFGVKDSGRLIPGHGGLLDRLDGLLAVAPAAALLAAWLDRGGELWR